MRSLALLLLVATLAWPSPRAMRQAHAMPQEWDGARFNHTSMQEREVNKERDVKSSSIGLSEEASNVEPTNGYASFFQVFASPKIRRKINLQQRGESSSTQEVMVVVGIIICFVGNTLRALGLVLQKYSLQNSAEGVVYFTQPWWLFGFSLFVLAQAMNVVAMPFAPQVVLSSIGTWSVVVTPGFAWLILGEQIDKWDIAATFGVVIGLSMIIGSVPDWKTPEASAQRNEFLFTQCLTDEVVLLLVLVALGLCLFHALTVTMMPRIEAVSWALIAAASSGPLVLQKKMITVLLLDSASLTWSEYWLDIIAVALVSIFLIAILMHSLGRGLQKGTAVQVLPIYYSVGMLSQILMAAVALDELKELKDLETWHAVILVAGIAILLLCIAVMAKGLDRSASKPM